MDYVDIADLVNPTISKSFAKSIAKIVEYLICDELKNVSVQEVDDELHIQTINNGYLIGVNLAQYYKTDYLEFGNSTVEIARKITSTFEYINAKHKDDERSKENG